jgi:hypothetical protein
MLSAINARRQNDLASQHPREELKRYLESPLENVTDVVGFWGVCCTFHSYPSLQAKLFVEA